MCRFFGSVIPVSISTNKSKEKDLILRFIDPFLPLFCLVELLDAKDRAGWGCDRGIEAGLEKDVVKGVHDNSGVC